MRVLVLVVIKLIFGFVITAQKQSKVFLRAKATIGKETIIKADSLLNQKPITVTDSRCERSAGGKHDFYSEGDYWWPDPQNFNGPYIRRDGQSNPEIFGDHRRAMERFNFIAGTLASAYLITKNEKYAKAAFKHYKAWYIDTTTAMAPHMLYGQAIKGVVTGRGVGIIDMIHMVDVAKSISVFRKSKAFSIKNIGIIKGWFNDYLKWVNTHPYGIEERDAKNNHAACWVLQVGVYAQLVGNDTLVNYCKNRFKADFMVNQMALDGSFPLELARTKPYYYSSFNLDIFSAICQSLSTKNDNLWVYTLADGKNMKKALSFFTKYIPNKDNWPYKPDVMDYEKHPVAYPFLIFGFNQFGNNSWLSSWKQLSHFPNETAVVRALPIRNPLIWL
jgi:hypothetical protein